MRFDRRIVRHVSIGQSQAESLSESRSNNRKQHAIVNMPKMPICRIAVILPGTPASTSALNWIGFSSSYIKCQAYHGNRCSLPRLTLSKDENRNVRSFIRAPRIYNYTVPVILRSARSSPLIPASAPVRASWFDVADLMAFRLCHASLARSSTRQPCNSFRCESKPKRRAMGHCFEAS
jgi:hypothetical protein